MTKVIERLVGIIWTIVLCGGAGAVHAETAVGVITDLSSPERVTIIADPPRQAALFSVLQPGEQLLVRDEGYAVVQIAGKEQRVSAENSPFQIPVVETGDSVADNILDWALSVLGSSDASARGERAVAMASRGHEALQVSHIGSFQNYLSRRDQLVLLVGPGFELDYDGFSSVDCLLEPSFELLQGRLISVSTKALPPGQYKLALCAGQACRHFSMDWSDAINGELPESDMGNQHPLLAALTLLEEGDEFQLEGLQQLWAYRERYELANRLLARLVAAP